MLESEIKKLRESIDALTLQMSGDWELRRETFPPAAEDAAVVSAQGAVEVGASANCGAKGVAPNAESQSDFDSMVKASKGAVVVASAETQDEQDEIKEKNVKAAAKAAVDKAAVAAEVAKRDAAEIAKRDAVKAAKAEAPAKAKARVAAKVDAHDVQLLCRRKMLAGVNRDAIIAEFAKIGVRSIGGATVNQLQAAHTAVSALVAEKEGDGGFVL